MTNTNALLDLKREWEILHRDNEKYEQYSLLIKLSAVITTALLLIFPLHFMLSLLVIFIFWGQEAIWKTFQTRLSGRLLLVENASLLNDTELPESFQLYSHWLENRPSASALVIDYLRHGIKPTVIFPYAILLIIVAVFY